MGWVQPRHVEHRRVHHARVKAGDTNGFYRFSIDPKAKRFSGEMLRRIGHRRAWRPAHRRWTDGRNCHLDESSYPQAAAFRAEGEERHLHVYGRRAEPVRAV